MSDTDLSFAFDEDELPTLPQICRMRRPRVLIADDDRVVRSELASRLVREGYDVFEVDTGTDLVKTLLWVQFDALPSEGIDVIVVDHLVPGIPSIEALKRLRRARCDIPAILMTDDPSEELEAQARRLATAVLAKPFEVEALHDLIAISLLPVASDAGARGEMRTGTG